MSHKRSFVEQISVIPVIREDSVRKQSILIFEQPIMQNRFSEHYGISIMRTFVYCRVSTVDQTAENQVQEVRAAGFDVKDRHIIRDMVSGSVKARDRVGFSRLLEKLDEGDLLVVTKLDRLGRNSIDVVSTIDLLMKMGVSVKCLALGDTDLASSMGQMTMTILAAVAQFERDLIRERTLAGLVRARSEGKVGGRPVALDSAQQAAIMTRLDAGEGVRALAREFGVAPSTVMRIRDKRQVKLVVQEC